MSLGNKHVVHFVEDEIKMNTSKFELSSNQNCNGHQVPHLISWFSKLQLMHLAWLKC